MVPGQFLTLIPNVPSDAVGSNEKQCFSQIFNGLYFVSWYILCGFGRYLSDRPGGSLVMIASQRPYCNLFKILEMSALR